MIPASRLSKQKLAVCTIILKSKVLLKEKEKDVKEFVGNNPFLLKKTLLALVLILDYYMPNFTEHAKQNRVL